MATITLSQVAEQHDLLSVGVTYLIHPDGSGFYSASVQWADPGKTGGRECALQHGETESAALKNALAEMAKVRTLDLELVA